MVWSWFDGFMLVLYVCERVGSNVGCTMAADRERSSARMGSSRLEDLTRGFPIQISLPDGETQHHHFNPCLRHNGGPEQEAELIRPFLKPPENKCLSDVEDISSQRTCSMRVLGIGDDWGGATRGSIPLLLHPHRSKGNGSNSHTQHRHTSPMDGSSHPCHLHYRTRGPSTENASYSLSPTPSSVASYSTSVGSPRGRKGSFQMQLFPPFFSPLKEKGSHEGSSSRRQMSRPGGYAILGGTSPAPTSALADIAMVPCDTSTHGTPPSFLSNVGHRDQMPILQEAYAPITHEQYLPMEDDPPPVYSEVIDNPSLYRSVSKLERRTNRGKI